MIDIVYKYGLAKSKLKMHNAFIGVSICSHYFSKSNIISIANWARQKYSRLLILIADDPQAFTFMATKKIDFESALSKARKIGLEKYNSITKWIQSTRIENITILRWRDFSSDKKFLKIIDSVYQCYNNDNNFKNDINKQIVSRNNSFSDDLQFAVIRDKYFNIASQYVLNELSIMIYLQEYSNPFWQIQIYPLPMPLVLLGVYENKYKLDYSLSKSQSGYIQIVKKEAT